MDVFDIPMYPIAVAARLTKINYHRARRWFKGYRFAYAVDSGEIRRESYKEPLVKRAPAENHNYASFLDLIDLLFIKGFLDRGISLQRLRKALEEARRILNIRHFAQEKFFTSGKDIYLMIKNSEGNDALLDLLPRGQWVITRIILKFAKQVEFSKDTGYAQRWYPRKQVVVDPRIAFGQPSLVRMGIPTSTIYELFLSEGKDYRRVSFWMDIPENEVKAAVEFEEDIRSAA